MPVLMPPVTIGRHQYVDGGVKDIAPIGKAIAEGATHVLALVMAPDAEHRESVNEQFTGILDIAKRTFGLLADEVLDTDIKIAEMYSAAVDYVERIKANAKDRLGLDAAQRRRLLAGGTNPFINKRPVEITVIRPDAELTDDSLEFDPRKMHKMVDLGYDMAKKVATQAFTRKSM